MPMPTRQELTAYSIYKLINTAPRSWPFQHLVIEDFLAPELYERLVSAQVEPHLEQRSRHMEGRSAEARRYVLQLSSVNDLSGLGLPEFQLLKETLTDSLLVTLLVKRFRDRVVERHGTIDFDVGVGVEYICDRTGYGLAPHTDTAQKVVTTLIYLADRDADPNLGTSLYQVSDPSALPKEYLSNARLPRAAFSRVTTVPYRPNTALIFAPGPQTFHGVEPVADAGAGRKLLQFQLTRAASRSTAAAAGQAAAAQAAAEQVGSVL